MGSIAAHDESVELRYLRSFAAVVRHGGFTRAAEALHLAQPAVSAQVRRLEAELGTPLLHRTTRTVRLTRAGELLLDHAERILGEVEAARADLDRLAGTMRGHVRLGAIQALEPLDLPAALAAFAGRYPGVTLGLGSGPGRHLTDELDAGRIDLALAPIPEDVPERFAVRPLFTEELVAVTSPRHRLAPTAELHLGDLRDDRFVCLPPDSGLRTILDREARRAGFRPEVPFECTHLGRIRDLVAHDLGVALLARSVAEAPGPRVAIHPLRPAPVLRPVGLLRLRDHPHAPAADACADFLESWARCRTAGG